MRKQQKYRLKNLQPQKHNLLCLPRTFSLLKKYHLIRHVQIELWLFRSVQY